MPEVLPETRIALLEQNNITIMEKIDAIIATLDRLEDKLETSLDKKADKESVDRIQKIINWAGAIIGAMLLTSMVIFIEKVLLN